MPSFGVCCSPNHSAALAEAGFDYIEANAQAYFQGKKPDEDVDVENFAAGSVLPLVACNCLMPGHMKIVGPDRNAAALELYINNVLRRAESARVPMLVFGAGGSRNVPEGFDRGEALAQIVEFLRMAGAVADTHGVTIAVEPLRSQECNILNSLAEAMEVVRAVDSPAVKCLVDSYHHWSEDEPTEAIVKAGDAIAHVHVADLDGRVAPGESGDVAEQYRVFFGALKQIGYDGRVSIEGSVTFEPEALERTLKFMKAQWDAAD
ncbi:MAG: sugar phosphate isomerase/epimerase family protein [Planctomycetota bacterium]